MHASDQDLVAYLDGELPTGERGRVRDHMERCWHCRTRLANMEREVQRLTVDMDEWPYPDSAWMRQSKSRLKGRLEVAELDIANSVGTRLSRFFPIGAFAAIAAGLALVIAAWFSFQQQGAISLDAEETISRAIAVDEAEYVRPVTQHFRLEIEELKPSRRSLSHDLEIWSDPGSKRFASRLREPNGKLVHALWRPAGQNELIYAASLSATVRERALDDRASSLVNSLAETGLGLNEIEAGFMRWLERRIWDPISFAKGISRWSSQDGVSLRAEEIRVAGAPPLLRISAERMTRQMIAVWSVSLDSKNYRPKLETLRFITPERTVEVRLTPKVIRAVSEKELSADVFEPEIPLAVRANAIPSPEIHPPIREVDPPAVSEPSASESTLRAVHALYLLHRVGACMGEPVHIEEEGGHARIWNPKRSERSIGDSGSGESDLQSVLGVLADMRRTPPMIVDRSTGTEGNRRFGEALMQAWALKRLAEDFPESRTAGLPEESRQIFAQVVRDHLVALRTNLFGEGEAPFAGSPSSANVDWRRSSEVVFELLRAHREEFEASGGKLDATSYRDVLRKLHEIEASIDTGRSLRMPASVTRRN